MAQEIQEILNRAKNDGMQIGALLEALGGTRPRRTLVRRLNELRERGVIRREGAGRGTRYFINDAEPAPPARPPLRYPVHRSTPALVREPAGRNDPEGTPSAEPDEWVELRDAVRRPLAARQPVGYRREFLDAYVANETRYLPEDLRRELWKVGQSEHMAALPPGTYARMVLDRLLIDLSWNSSRLEGNTYSLLETDHLLDQGREPDEERRVEAQMILNHKGAIEFLVEDPPALGYDRYTFCNLHAILTEGLLKNPKAEGRLREIPVGIGGSVYHPSNVPALLADCFDHILATAAAVDDPFERSVYLMVHLPYLQGFEDGNKRLSRLAANLPLVQRNLAPLSFVGVSARAYADALLAVYEFNRVELMVRLYAEAYRKSAARYASIRSEIGEPDPMRVRYRDELKEQVRAVVVRGLGKPEAAHEIRRWARRHVTADDQDAFVEWVETLLLDLHEGSIARMRIRPSEFQAWWPVWSGDGGPR